NDTFIIVGDHTLNIPDQGVPYSYPKITASFYSYSKNETPSFSNNNLQIESVRVHKFDRVKDCTPHFNKYNLLMKIVEVYVVNKGDIPIEEFNLFIRAASLQNCSDYNPEGIPYDQEKSISGIMLMPGDSMKVLFQDMKFPQFIIDSAKVNLCVWTNAVNQKIDIDMSDNIICSEFELIQTEYVEAPIITPEENELLIYPNPSSDHIAVSLKTAPFDPSLIEFFDMIGRRMQSNLIAPRATFKEIDISNLPKGIYFVRVKNDLIEETVRFFKD
ncbi:MAG: T9SS type A sorting domain-containing protein, partial [Saprospiraceae bacterium]